MLEYALRFVGAVFLLAITVVGIPFAIRTLVRWSLGSQAVLLNNESAKDAISHSCQLVKGLWWQVAGAGLLVFFASGLVGQIAFFVWPRGAPGTIVSAIWEVLSVPFQTAFWTLAYLRLAEQDESAPALEAQVLS
ncbi:MAG TPA: hypothetical protein VIP09_10755 [Dehalococcoidia bacterium]